MQSFIEEVAHHVYQKFQTDLGRVEIVFPNRRAGIFFRTALSRLIEKPIWMPAITSFEDFVVSRSGFRKMETLEAVFKLYEVYKHHQVKEETLDNFFFWGEMILRDFEEIDQYLINTDNLFKSIKSQKELDEEFYFLDEEEKRIIQSFWSTFLPTTSKTQESFLATWKLLSPIYHDFRQKLESNREGYGGMIYRRFLENDLGKMVGQERKIVFAGFNALTRVEEAIIKHYLETEDAEVLWDLDKYYVGDEHQEAGYFLRHYAKDATLKNTFPEKLPDRISKLERIHTVGVSLEVGQTKAMAEHLSQLMQSEGFSPEKTVIVLPNEYMLLPVLHSLPEEAGQLNITMGYPLKDTPVFSLIEQLLKLQESRRHSVVHGNSYYHKPVVEILGHSLVQPLLGKEASDYIGEVKKRNLIFLYEDELPRKSDIGKILFSHPQNILEYLLKVLSSLHEKLEADFQQLDREFLSRYYQHVLQLQELMGDKSKSVGIDFLIKLFRRLARSLKIPFTGEPLQGLQIMGILETRNLDFENVFVLNMNETSWPAKPKNGSFIPYNLRKAFDLPVFQHQDAIYAYLFYSLLQRSKNVWLYYNTVSEFNVNGEISRYVHQLGFESHLEIKNEILANPIAFRPPKEITIPKTDALMSKLKRYLVVSDEWTPRLTPSALDTYLYCRLRFYFKYVEELYEPEEMQEELSPMVFGNILHDTMEILYTNLIKKQKRDVVDVNDFFGLDADISGAVNRAFIKHYNVKNEKKFKLEGRNIIAAEIIRKTVSQILRIDQGYAPFKILGLETTTRDGYKVDFPIEVNGEHLEVGLKGKIDRLDLKDGVVRVVDYKTGKDSREFTTVSSLIDRNDDKRNKAAFQVLFYSYLYYSTSKHEYERIEPGLFNSRDLFDSDFTSQIYARHNRNVTPVLDFRTHLEDFENALKGLLEELFDSSVPFDQVEDEKKCKWCPYNGICSRS